MWYSFTIDTIVKTVSKQSFFHLVFFISGGPALLYQVAWQRMLSLYFGVDIYSTTITVAAFMAGLGLGSLAGGWLADRNTSLPKIYAMVELALGGFGALSLYIFSVIGRNLAGEPLGTVAWATFALLIFPTFLMGMTLPVMSRIVISDTAIGAPVARLYGLNALGAAVAGLLGCYVFIGTLGLDGTVLLAACMNVALGLVLWSVCGKTTARAVPEAWISPTRTQPSTNAWMFVAMLSLGSGFVALGYEIVWYRVLTILLHGTVYVFGTILFVFLLGIAVGSLAARRTADRPAPLLRFGRAQLVISAYALALFTVLGRFSHIPGLKHIIAASFFTSFHPSPELAAGQINIFSMYSLVDVFLWTTAILGMPTFMMGYGFPQLIRAATHSCSAVGSAIARTYFANIIGSTVGSLLVGFVLLEYAGTERTLALLILVGAVVGLTACLRDRFDISGRPGKTGRTEVTATVVIVIITVSAFPGRAQLIKAIHLSDLSAVQFAAREDRTGVVALRTQHRMLAFNQERPLVGVPRLYIDGAAHGRGDDGGGPDPAVTLALARAPAPRRVLSIGLGDGVMCATALAGASVTELVIVELKTALLDLLRVTTRGKELAASPRVRLINDDGRRWLLANPNEMFDLIMMWPLHAAHAYYGNLFSKEFFELAIAHLTPDGMLVARTVDLFSTPRTLISVFKHVIRVDQVAYISSRSQLGFDESRLPLGAADFVKYVEADHETIAAHTRAAPLNLDLRPKAEYYLVYPYVWSLVVGIPRNRVYSETNKLRFAALVNPVEPSESVLP